jgi:hypothetical protein
MVRVEEEWVAGPDTTTRLTGRPELAVALIANGATPKVLEAMVGKVIVWLALLTVRLNDLLEVEPRVSVAETV